MDPLVDCLKNRVLRASNNEAWSIRFKSARYILYDDKLYRHSLSSPLLRCVTNEATPYIMREIHKDICGNHTGGQALAHKALQQSYYWPTMKKDTVEFARRCDKCQRFSSYTKSHPETLNSMISQWLFVVWGIDIIGALPAGKENVKYAVVAVDYFTKWVKAEPVVAITSKKMQSFVWRFTIDRYEIPQNLVSDNGKQFDSEEFKDFCNELGIVKSFSAVVHP